MTREELLAKLDTSNLATWWTDFRWALGILLCRRYRRSLLFHERVRFDNALRPKVPKLHPQHDPAVIEYPDAIYHVTPEDIRRAIGLPRALPPSNEAAR